MQGTKRFRILENGSVPDQCDYRAGRPTSDAASFRRHSAPHAQHAISDANEDNENDIRRNGLSD